MIALTIQGITPDTKNFASINALKLLWPAITDADHMVDEDDFPDDLCEPVRVDIDLSCCYRADPDGSPCPRWAMDEPRWGRVKLNSMQFVACAGRLRRTDKLIRSLCRLNC